MGIVFRRAEPGDAHALAELAAELGYACSSATLAARLARLLRRRNHALFVAHDGPAAPLGWIHVQVYLSLLDEPVGLVSGLVVAERVRRRGIGRALMAAAEAWARARGVSAMRLRSRDTRVEAHDFYRSLGYVGIKTQLQMRKPLEGRAPAQRVRTRVSRARPARASAGAASSSQREPSPR